MRVFRSAPPSVQLVLGVGLIVALWLAINGFYQVIRKPTELFFPVSGMLYRAPAQTWKAYADAFESHSTAIMTPELLAALAQVEGSGNPIVRTYWRWSPSYEPFEIYRPASSAVGMYQITDGTFAQARRYCIRSHRVVEDGPWNEFRTCWFNNLYMRVIASHSIEMTSAYLDRHVTYALSRALTTATLRQKQELAAVIHLCGAGAGERYARRGLRLTPGQKCGDHDVRAYVARVNQMNNVFARLRAERVKKTSRM
ncbi:MAG TPA: hypothetical protein VHK24_01800 [Steroidobacter sp.]|jgi:hypothetical protein|nr:hypothetical protein [Steroidobacter sp.]